MPINYLALLVAALVRMVVGGLWYSPALLLSQWLALVGQSREDMKVGFTKNIIVDFVGSFVMAFILAHVMYHVGAKTVGEGALVGFGVWLGFIAPVTLSTVNHEKRPLALFFVNNGYQLITLLIIGALLAVWR